MRLTLLVLSVLLLTAASSATGGADRGPREAVVTTVRGLTVLECDINHRNDCTLVTEEGEIVWLATDLETWERMPGAGSVVDLRARYAASGTHRDAYRALEWLADEEGWVRRVGTARCLVVHGHVGEVHSWGTVEILVPVRWTPTKLTVWTAAEQLIAFEPLRSWLARVQTTELTPKLRRQKMHALKLRLGRGREGFTYYEIMRLASSSSMPAGRCR